MTVTKVGFPSILKDNDMAYLAYVLSNLDKLDSGCIVSIINGIDKIIFDVLPSDFFRKKMLLGEIIRIHRVIGIELEFSRTLEYSPSIYFSLDC